MALMVDLRIKILFADSIIFGSSVAFLEKLILTKNQIDDSIGETFEKKLAETARLSVAHGLNFSFLPFLPRLSGISGTYNLPYDDGWINWFRRNVRYSIKFYAARFLLRLNINIFK
jgi:hypothetical protein